MISIRTLLLALALGCVHPLIPVGCVAAAYIIAFITKRYARRSTCTALITKE